MLPAAFTHSSENMMQLQPQKRTKLTYFFCLRTSFLKSSGGIHKQFSMDGSMGEKKSQPRAVEVKQKKTFAKVRK
jgi:hypothetical protein